MDKNRQNKDSVSQKILETTRETERLKQELEALIASGIRGRAPTIPSTSQITSLDSNNKVQIIKSYDSKHSQHVKKPQEETQDSPSPKKTKAYNIEEAREYIKKQRGKRMEELKNQKSYTQIAAEIRKEKLQELRQKANEIVKKNVEAKRARSRSREPPILRSRSSNRDQQQSMRSRSRPKDQRSFAPEQSVIEGFNCAGKSKKLLMHNKQEVPGQQKSQSRSAKAVSMDSLNTIGTIMKETSSNFNKGFENKNLKAPEISALCLEKKLLSVKAKDPNLLYPPENKYGPRQSQEDLHQIDHSKSVGSETTEETKKSKLSSHTSSSKHSAPEPAENKSSTHSNKGKIIVHSNITLRSAETISPLTKPQEEPRQTPEWLKELPQADPYNFINTVKRQLKYVVNERKPPTFVDIAVQGNLEDTNSAPHSGRSSKKSDLKSFISHKCLNLDPKTIEHIELHRNKEFQASKDGPTVTQTSSCSENDSDTSKNIPSISSESGSSLRRNAEFIRQSYDVSDLRPAENAPLNLDVQKVEEVRLKNPKKSSSLSVPGQDEVERIKKHLFKDSDRYSSDFVATDLSKSRDSIISFNCAKVSPNKVPLFLPNAPLNDIGLVSLSQDSNAATQKSNTFLSSCGSIESERRLISSSKPSFCSEHLSKNITTRSVSERSATANSKKEQKSSGQLLELLETRTGNLGSGESSPKFNSLFSTLRPSTNTSESRKSEKVKSQSRSTETIESQKESRASDVLGERSEIPSERSETFGSDTQKNDGVTELVNMKGSFAGRSSESLLSEGTKSISSKTSTKSYKSEPEKTTSKKEDKKNILSKSESNLYADKLLREEPKLSLNIKKTSRKPDPDERQALMRNVTIRSGDQSREDLNKTNEIHLKFEAEIHLLTDFNKSIRRFSEIEKAFESLSRNQNASETVTKKVLQNRDTQTSVMSTSSKRTTSQVNTGGSSKTDLLALDLTQASDATSALTTINFEDSLPDTVSNRTSSLVQMSRLDVTESPRGKGDFGEENAVFKSVVGMSLRMFDQLIKDEDVRIENWKKVVRIREQALLDRTRGELVWLEMQKKQLIETGKLAEASLIKKKQRGILLKHQQEKHEMQRLKQMQKEDSHNRKTLLKKERNQIKNQLLSDKMLSKLKPGSHRERRLSGPFKVIQTSGTTVRSETSLSKSTAGTDQEIKSITTRTSRTTHSVVNILSETSDNLNTDVEPFDPRALKGRANFSAGAVSSMKKTLLMREYALAKRRKTVEELLQWHKKLLDEEKAIEDLETKIGTIISKIPSQSNETTPRKDKTPSGEETGSSISQQLVLEKLQDPANTVPSEPNVKNIPQEEIHSEDSNRVVSSANYSTDFDIESAPQNSDDQSSVSSISQLIEDFSKIEDNILNLMPKRPLQEEAKSEVSSRSTEATSQIEAKPVDSEEKIADAPVIIVEDPSEQSDENKVHSVQEELLDEGDLELNTEVVKSVSEQATTNKVPGDSTNSRTTSIEIVEHITPEEKNGIGDKKSDEDITIVFEEVAPATIEDQDSSSNDEVILLEESHLESQDIAPEATESVAATNEAPKASEETQISSHVTDIEIDDSSPTTGHRNITLRTKTEKDEQTATLSPPSIDDEGPQTHSEEATTKEDVSTLKQYEEIEDLEQPSTSRQNTTSPIASIPSKEDISNISEEKDEDSLSSPSSPSVAEIEAQPPSPVESFENKTDEEKAASLSVKSSGSNRSAVTSERLVETSASTSPPPDEAMPLSRKEEETSKIATVTDDDDASGSASSTEGPAASSKVVSDSQDSAKASETSKSQSPSASSEVPTVTPPKSETGSSKSSSGSGEESTPSKTATDIKKHVQEILNVTSPSSRGDKSPRMQDLCVMTYDTSPVQSPESGSPMDERKPFSLGTEAEELHRKQLAIEQEIKLLKEQQQKEAGSPFYIREIPNKPPPPYTPPSKIKAPKSPSVVPGTKEEIEQITEYSAKIIHKAYLSSNLDNISISDNTLNLIAKNVDKGSYKYVFDLCKEIAKDHYGQFVEEAGPSWLRLDKKPVVAPAQPLDVNGLTRLMSKKLLEMFGFEKQETRRENAIMKWSRKKRDHVDEVLVQEMQAEEGSWTGFERDEALVKDRITNELMEMLLKETAQVLRKTVQKKLEGP